MNEKINDLVCSLTTAELRDRRDTVLRQIRNQVLETSELPNGYSFRFSGADEIVDMVAEFIKTERMCCQFFAFSLDVKGDKSGSSMTLTGPEGVKNFIRDELGLGSF